MQKSNWIKCGSWAIKFVLCTLLMVPLVGAEQVRPVPAPLGQFNHAADWLQSPPLHAEDLRGKVVLVDFWDYSCINCIRSIPYVRAWADKYKSAGLVVIGVHAPEFEVEKQKANVQRAVTKFGINYPVVLDNDYNLWRAFQNHYWPAHYLIDAQGRIRYQHFGEGEYDETERAIRLLLEEAHGTPAKSMVSVSAEGVEASADFADVRSPETYIGYARARNFMSAGGLLPDVSFQYAAPSSLQLNDWALAGKWNVHQESATLDRAAGQIRFRFHARDLHLVLGTTSSMQSVRFRVLLDGRAPGLQHGVDVDEQGYGVVSDHRLYQLVRQSGDVTDHVFSIEFEQPGVVAYSFTFG